MASLSLPNDQEDRLWIDVVFSVLLRDDLRCLTHVLICARDWKAAWAFWSNREPFLRRHCDTITQCCDIICSIRNFDVFLSITCHAQIEVQSLTYNRAHGMLVPSAPSTTVELLGRCCWPYLKRCYSYAELPCVRTDQRVVLGGLCPRNINIKLQQSSTQYFIYCIMELLLRPFLAPYRYYFHIFLEK